jgi:hypothetical protein
MRWRLALVQHPMYFLIKEDETCAERTPPWGEPSIELYIERVRHNLAALRRYPQLKIGYEWSGLELELLSQDAPDVFQEMCALAREGQKVYLAKRHGGELPTSLGVVSLTDAAINSTAVKVDGEDIICRVYGVAERVCPVNAKLHNLQPTDLRSLRGESVPHLRPFQIGTLVLGPGEQQWNEWLLWR